MAEGKDRKSALQQFLLMYRTTPHTTTGISHAQMLFQHIPNNGLPTFKPNKTEINPQKASHRERNKAYIDN